MQSYYEINVSLNGRHFFATAPHSILTEQLAQAALKVFRHKFTKAEGYEVSVTHWQCTGTSIA